MTSEKSSTYGFEPSTLFRERTIHVNFATAVPSIVVGAAPLLLGLALSSTEAGIALLIVWGLIFLIGFLPNLFVIVHPNEPRVLQRFGKYVGTLDQPGLHFKSVLHFAKPISKRIRNFESAQLKVNDADGNPIEIAAIIVWQVVDSAEALFHVDDYVAFVRVQTEAALRSLAAHYPYDAHEPGQLSLRANASEIADKLQEEVQARLDSAGVRIIEARISHLAYAPEIASAMLQVQQAGAIVAARQKMVEGAVGMVETALEMLAERKIVTFDEARKADAVANLLVVLTSHTGVQPVLPTGGHTHLRSERRGPSES